MFKNKFQRFRKSETGYNMEQWLFAIFEDVIGIFMGIVLSVFPSSTIKKLVTSRWEKFKIRRLNVFVNWDLPNWSEIYPAISKELLVHFNIRPEDKYVIPQVLTIDNTDGRFKLKDISLNLCEDKFIIDEKIYIMTNKAYEKWKSYKTGKLYFDNNVRLIDFSEYSGKLNLFVQSVNYEDYCRTNLVLDYENNNSSPTLREYLHNDGNLDDLAGSKLGNNLGINILLFTFDGCAILQKRSPNVMFRAGQLVPSGSGTVSKADIKFNDIHLNEVNALRELWEETGIQDDEIDMESLNFLGITRELARGGEPEMFFNALTKLSKTQIETRTNESNILDKWEWERVKYWHFGKIAIEELDESNKQLFIESVNEFLENASKKIGPLTVTLEANIILWANYRLKSSGFE